ncbi:MAG: L-threonylcarbamoyladenylate synthase [Candidatus Aminicenantaceae bacterium]
MTKIIKINTETVEKEKILEIAKALQKEEIIIYPTDTFYGVGANCFSRKVLRLIYKIKKRDQAKPISIIISNRNMVGKLAVDIPDIFWKITDNLWPGPLTVVLKASSNLPQELLGRGDSIGIRLPEGAWLHELVEQAGFPLTATSANISGKVEISNPYEVVKDFQGKVSLIVDGGETQGRIPSTVVDLTSGRPEILREGAVPFLEIEKQIK